MSFTKKGQDIGFGATQMGIIIFILFILAVLLFVLLLWFNPSYGKLIRRLDFW